MLRLLVLLLSLSFIARAEEEIALPYVFTGSNYGYKISYPADWEAVELGGYKLVIGGLPESKAAYATVVLQNIRLPHPADRLQSALDIIEAAKKQIESRSLGITELSRKPFFDDKSGLGGYQVVWEFDRKGQAFVLWQVVLPRNTALVAHSFAFTSPAGEFQQLLPWAQAILASWEITPE